MPVESLDTIIHEGEFLPIVEKNMQGMFEIYNFMMTKEEAVLPRKFFAKLEEEANVLESFLDDYDARNNKTFGFFTELVASVRGFATVCYCIKHVLVRYPKYNLNDSDRDRIKTLSDLLETLGFCISAIKGLFKELTEETERNLGLTVPKGVKSEQDFLEKLIK